MAFPFRGNTSTDVTTSIMNLPTLVNSFSIVNKTAGTIGVNVYAITALGTFSVAPLNQQLGAGQMYESDKPIIILAGEQIKVSASGSIDYDFNMDNLE